MKYCIIILTLFSIELSAQSLNKYWVQFTDKKGTPYSIFKPQEFLSPRAIERRQRLGIEIDKMDLPVSQKYINELKKKGATIYTVSKWFNAATIYLEDEGKLEQIKKLPFVRTVEATGRYTKPPSISKQKNRNFKSTYPRIRNYYGYGWSQISMLNGQSLHQIGFRGNGMLIAILDEGFINFDVSPFFDSIRVANKVLMSRDFVDNDNWVYEVSNHGFNAISTIIGNLPGLLVGTSPDATVVCIRTEDINSELRIEEDNWIAGAEYADSLGVDVINSSLSYTFFNNPEMSYAYQDMDGNTARISIGADIAVKKGILVVNCAGNDGNKTWRYVGAPADADSVMAVGAVDRNRLKANFSSFGPTRDGRIKPNVSARGEQTVVATLTYRVDSVNGTSFSSPIIAGMVTSLWQAFPEKNNMEIKNAVEQSGSLANNPNNYLGYGIPNMMKAYQILSNSSVILSGKSKSIAIPNFITNYFDVILQGINDDVVEIKVSNMFGKTLKTINATVKGEALNRYRINDLRKYPAGNYIISVKVGTIIYKVKILNY
ncbi:MAG: S8 family serine peptidase [Saprospiraceae bacterium]|nr:S8 family serine peptidase [Saprospiraceae bacterium]